MATSQKSNPVNPANGETEDKEAWGENCLKTISRIKTSQRLKKDKKKTGNMSRFIFNFICSQLLSILNGYSDVNCGVLIRADSLCGCSYLKIKNVVANNI